MAKLNGKSGGIDYYKLNAVIDNHRYAVHVVRISPNAAPFVLGPITNAQPSNTKNNSRPYIYRKRITRRVSSIIKDLISKGTIKISRNGKPQILSPVWVSNGTFYIHDTQTFVFGPAIHQGKVELDVSGQIGLTVPKIHRWYFAQGSRSASNNGISIRPNSPQVLASNLSQSYKELLGGAAALVVNGSPKTNSFWSSDSVSGNGGDFNGQQWYTTGPVVALSKGANPVCYLILIDDNSRFCSWEKMANYLVGSFTNDINAAHKSKDQGVKDAIVYDGGSSSQLWVRDGKGTQQFKIKGDVVPNYIGLWA